jgi:hypothetical protein
VKRRTALATGVAVIGGAALLVSVFLPWVRRGPGNSLRGHDLIDTLVALGHELPGASTARLTVLWYVVPALGAASWISIGLTGPTSRATRVVVVAATVFGALVVLAFGRLAGFGDLGAGPYAVMLGAVAMCAGAFAIDRPRRSLQSPDSGQVSAATRSHNGRDSEI